MSTQLIVEPWQTAITDEDRSYLEYRRPGGTLQSQPSIIVGEEDWILAGARTSLSRLRATAFPDLTRAEQTLKNITAAATDTGRGEPLYQTKRHGEINRRTGQKTLGAPLSYFTTNFDQSVHLRKPDKLGNDRPFSVDLIPDFAGGQPLEIEYTPSWMEVGVVELHMVTAGSTPSLPMHHPPVYDFPSVARNITLAGGTIVTACFPSHRHNDLSCESAYGSVLAKANLTPVVPRELNALHRTVTEWRPVLADGRPQGCQQLITVREGYGQQSEVGLACTIRLANWDDRDLVKSVRTSRGG